MHRLRLGRTHAAGGAPFLIGQESDRLLFPNFVHVHQSLVGTLGRGLAANVRDLRRLADQCGQRVERDVIIAVALGQPRAQQRQHVHGLRKQFHRFLRRPLRQIFQEQRDVIGQFAGAQFEAVLVVNLQQVHHRLTAIPRLAVDVLVQVQRQRAAPVERRHVPLLPFHQVGALQPEHERLQRPAFWFRHQVFLVERFRHLAQRGLYFRLRIGQQGRQDFECLHRFTFAEVEWALPTLRSITSQPVPPGSDWRGERSPSCRRTGWSCPFPASSCCRS